MSAEKSRGGGHNGRPQILIVDDEPAILEVLAQFLVDYDVCCVCGGEEALEQCRSRPFDVILCDLMMPGLTGMDLHHVLSSMHPRIAERMVFISGGAHNRGVRDFLQRVGNPRLGKPFTRGAVLEEVAGILQRHPR
ncbi:MAG: response regulator [Deltaproteobacteria bacterium]|nr:response regulator [Deltaproteobacteria bacterium]MBW2254406.1 response regulator [Deltaproteobacteria bacterium]